MDDESRDTRAFFSRPQPVDLSKDFPFFAFISAVELPRGCLPPSNRLKRRIVVGRGSSKKTAFELTRMEAIERYCSQYQEHFPEQVVAVRVFGSSKKVENSADVYLGHPRAVYSVNSKGTAAGETTEAAAIRAILELIEKAVINEKDTVWWRIDVGAFKVIKPYCEWLNEQGRVLVAKASVKGENVFVVSAACTDFDGGRPTEGSAGDVDLERAVRRACEEAMFLWRNMVQLEMNAVALSEFPEDELRAVRLYRGCTPSPFREQNGLKEFCMAPPMDSFLSLEEVAEIGLMVLGNAIALFDLTNEELGVPVIRALAK